MKSQIDVEEIIRQNPKLNRDAIQQQLEFLEGLRTSGILNPTGYRLSLPTGQRCGGWKQQGNLLGTQLVNAQDRTRDACRHCGSDA